MIGWKATAASATAARRRTRRSISAAGAAREPLERRELLDLRRQLARDDLVAARVRVRPLHHEEEVAEDGDRRDQVAFGPEETYAWGGGRRWKRLQLGESVPVEFVVEGRPPRRHRDGDGEDAVARRLVAVRPVVVHLLVEPERGAEVGLPPHGHHRRR